ncbi:hypothetical protein AB0C96_02555 [Streptomyces sp. NPDC048506]|uniref:hypothetical protein n=1 Tax=Streptomyces sp. NPDC048506 TaxID=3155028 RepID=UPI003447B469
MQRAQKIRMTGLAGAAVLAIAVPLGAATAGPADTFMSDTSGATATAENSRSAEKGIKGERGGKAGKGRTGAARSNGPVDPLADLGLPLLYGRTTRCGPSLASARGIEAQTCVLAESGRTWARTYYRNITGAPLRAVLTLLRPDDRTVQVNCEIPAADRPGVCETPAAPTVRRARTAYGAVAEISDAAGKRLLLRSGGNSASGESGSLL